uniref:Consortin, connexin sorting protein b n=1 Tax=Takifugu rubripes TaxID=31033 RepID=A0A674MW39_TAKRU
MRIFKGILFGFFKNENSDLRCRSARKHNSCHILEGAGAPSPELLASLQSLRDNVDSTLLPHSLHQVCKGGSFPEIYQWAIQFLQLEKLYHERLLSNIAALQENWGTVAPWQHRRYKCRVHALTNQGSVFSDDRLEAVNQSGDQQQSSESEPSQSSEGEGEAEGEEEEEEEAGEEQMCKEGQETPEEEELTWEMSSQSSSPDGLVSILKRRRASLDGLPPPSINVSKQNSKRKVRFSEPEDGAEPGSPSPTCVRVLLPDEVGGDSCLILLLLCLVTVVISIGGTALYCTLVGSYSSICTDFTHNADFYIANVRGFLAGLRRWLPLPT